MPLCPDPPLCSNLSPSDLSASLEVETAGGCEREGLFLLRMGWILEPVFLSEYFGTAFHSSEGTSLPGPRSLTRPHLPSVSAALSPSSQLKPVECQHLAHMFISSESVINFLWFAVNETVLCVCVCVCVCVSVCVCARALCLWVFK